MDTLAVRQDLAVLAEVSAALAEAGLDLSVLLDTITDLLATHVADVALVYLLAEDGVTLQLESLSSEAPGHFELAQSVLSSRVRRSDDPGLLGRCFATSQPVLVNEIDPADFRAQLPEAYRELLDRRPPLHSILYVPLLSDGEPFGVLTLSRAFTPKSFEEDEVDLACDIAELAAPAVANARLHHRLAEMTALFEAAFAHAPIGMAVHSAGPGPSSFIRVNDALAQTLGRSETELAGTPVSDLVDASDRDHIDELLAQVASGDLLEHSDEILLTRGDGTIVAVSIDSRAVRIESGTLLILTQVRPLPRS